MQGKKVLIAVTSNDQLGTTGRKTGYYLPEVTHPFFALLRAGFDPSEIDIVSPKGGAAPMDEKSRDLNDANNREFVEKYLDKVEHSLAPAAINPQDYQAIIFAGGHGVMWDFPEATDLLSIAATIYEQNGGIVAAVCHGPSALVNLTLSDGSYLVANKHVAAFTDDEERAANLANVVPFLLASTLVSRGAKHESADLWQAKVVVDGRLVTGQNPASALGVGEAVAQLLTTTNRTTR